MRACHSSLMVVSLLALTMVLPGCAKRPGTAAESVPAPGPRMEAGAAPDVVHAAERGAGMNVGRGERPSPKDFMSVPDLLDINFDFDRSDIKSDAAKVLEANAQWLKAHPGHLILIEGHTDERGTNEYNLALGDRRAKSSMSYLVSHGVQASRITLISYGEDRPLCQAQQEECWRQNRRAHFAVKPQ